MKRLIHTFALFLLTYCAFSQQKFIIHGNVLDAKTNITLPFVNIFLEGTTIGTQTNQEGNFVLRNIPIGNYRLVASMIGYTPTIYSITVSDKNIITKISLSEDIKILEEVKVVGNRDKIWEKQYKLFEKEFLGADFDKNKVKILNKEILNFNSENDILTAQANSPIEVENRYLGYKISYILQDFEKKKATTSFKGLARYEALIPVNIDEEATWKKNQINAYQGSIRHFMKALLDDKLVEEGFDAYFLNPNYINKSGQKPLFYDLTTTRHFIVRPKEIIQQKPPNFFTLQWTYPIEVVYNKQRVSRTNFPDAPYPYSILIPKTAVILTENGNLINPYAIEMKGKMGESGIADLLPLDYFLPKSGTLQNEENTKPSTFLREFLIQNQDQKIFIHTDKSNYFTTDTLWYKAYITDVTSNELVENVQKIFIEFLLPNGSPLIRQTLKSQENGTAWSSFLLPDTLQSGTYILRAYTNFMRNSEQSLIFQKEIFVQKYRQKTLEKNDQFEQIQVQFFPEGGQYIWGVPAKMGIKISNHQDKIINGKLIDKKGEKVCEFSTNILGIGSFILKNEKDNPLKVLINEKEYYLPTPQNEGFSIKIDNAMEDSLSIDVFSNSKKDFEFITILVQSKGIIYEELNKKLDGNKTHFIISKQNLPTGIYQLTLFDKDLMPRCERLIFIQKNENLEHINVECKAENSQVKLDLKLISTDEKLTGEFSMAVADASQVAMSDNTENIYSYLLLSSEVRGKIDNPNYYFLEISPERKKNLDDLLLTQGWRRYKWEDILKKTSTTKKKFQQFEPLSMHGNVFSDEKNPILLPEVNLIVLPIDPTQKPIFTKADKNGNFFIENLDFIDSTSFVIKVMNLKGKELRATIIIDKEQGNLINRTYTKSEVHGFDATLLKNGELRKSNEFLQNKLLDGVTITAKTIIDYDYDTNGNRLNKLYGKPDGVINVNEKTIGNNIIQIIQGKIPAIKVSGDGNTEPFEYLFRGKASLGDEAPPVFLLDGVVFDAPRDFNSPLMTINPQEIERIEFVVNEGTSMYGSRGAGGIIAIYTKKGSTNTSNFTTKLQKIRLKGFERYREFYVPTYEKIEGTKDIRDIVFWKPSFELNQGQTKSIIFKNNDTATQLLVTIEGILTNGKPYSMRRVVEIKK